MWELLLLLEFLNSELNVCLITIITITIPNTKTITNTTITITTTTTTPDSIIKQILFSIRCLTCYYGADPLITYHYQVM
jgi:hypothetical protein